MTVFECTKCKLTWFLKEIEVYQDFDLRHEEGQFKSLEALADAKRALKKVTFRQKSSKFCIPKIDAPQPKPCTKMYR